MSRVDQDQLVRHIRVVLPEPWPAWPGGWPNEIEAALLDAVFSVRASYGSETTGVRSVVRRWRDHRAGELDDLTHLATWLDQPGQLQAILGNNQVLPGGAPKAAGCAQAAAALVDIGVRRSRDVSGGATERRAWKSVKGLGDVTWSYFLMLLGTTGVKADVMLRRFVAAAIERQPSAPEARALVISAANELNVDATLLDHAIWRYQRAGSSPPVRPIGRRMAGR